MLWCLSVCKRRKHYCLVSPSTVWFVYDTALDGQRCCIVVVGATSVAVERLLRLLSVPLQQRSDSWRGRLLDNGATRHHTCYPACLQHHQSLRQPPRFVNVSLWREGEMLLPCASDGPDTVPKSPIQPCQRPIWTRRVFKHLAHVRQLFLLVQIGSNWCKPRYNPAAPKSWPLLTLPHTSISSLSSVLMCIKLHCTEQI